MLDEPSCPAEFSCQLSGDSTAYLSDMTWLSWTTTEAVGTGTELLNDCTPSCAGGTMVKVQTTVTFSKPVQACSGGTVRWVWTYATFSYPQGLPAELSGSNAPANPWAFTALASAAQQSCS
jgi:hypothetical protein